MADKDKIKGDLSELLGSLLEVAMGMRVAEAPDAAGYLVATILEHNEPEQLDLTNLNRGQFVMQIEPGEDFFRVTVEAVE